MITIETIADALDIDPVDDGVSYRVVLSPGQMHVAVDARGLPSLIVPAADLPERRNYLLGEVRVATHDKIRFRIGGETHESAAIIVTCLDRERPRSFSVFLHDLIRRLETGNEPPQTIISTALREWHELLTKRGRLSREDEIGLWGELTLLLHLSDVNRGVASWTGPNGDSVDLRGDGIALECKTTTRQWKHTLGLDQVNQVKATHAETYLVSLWVGTDPAGRSLSEVVDAVEAKLSDRAEFRRKLLSAGYSPDQRELYTDHYALLSDPALISMATVPRVREVDAGVSAVRFTVSVEHCSKLDEAAAGAVMERLVAKET